MRSNPIPAGPFPESGSLEVQSSSAIITTKQVRRFAWYPMLGLLLPLLWTVGARANETPDLPLVPEHVDQLVLVHFEGSERAYVVFCRGETIIATRPVTDQMFWNASEGKFQLIWNDGWRVERVVTADSLRIFYEVDEESTGLGEHLPWWGMFRNMRDLKAP